MQVNNDLCTNHSPFMIDIGLYNSPDCPLSFSLRKQAEMWTCRPQQTFPLPFIIQDHELSINVHVLFVQNQFYKYSNY